MHKDHPTCEAPKDPNQKIWRFIDFTKFISLIETNMLYFASLDQLDDPLEGYLGQATVEDLKNAVRNAVPAHKENYRKLIRMMKEARNHVRISCWHMNDFESAAMWKLYLATDDGIAIQSTYQRLRDAFGATPETVFIGQVNYLDFRTEFHEINNVIGPALSKRKSFEHERELRAVYYTPREDAKGRGVGLPVNLDCLMEEIYLSPKSSDWFGQLVDRMLSRSGIARTPRLSSLYENPPY